LNRIEAAIFVNGNLRQLFFELADLPRETRERVLEERRVPAELRAELKSLLEHDCTGVRSVTRVVTQAIDAALVSSLPHTHCGPYRLIRMIGSGGMGAVYLASRDDGEIDREVAVKLLRPDVDRPAWRERFLRERQLLACLNHASIARLFDAGHTDSGLPYLVMEFIEGTPIDEFAVKLDLRGQLDLFVRVCEGVSHAHQHSIIHRDLKPSNILVDSAGTPKLLDFGIGKALGAAADQTQTVERLLTPTYASPEQLRGGAQTFATDIYSLGAVLYKLLTGQSPRELAAGTASMSEEEIVEPSRLNSELPRDIDFIVQKALRFEPEERYSSVDALAEDVRAFLGSKPVMARSSNTWYRASKFLRRNRTLAAAATLTAASLYIGTGMAEHQRNVAEGRFLQGRQLASRILALNEANADLHDSSKARYELAAMSKQYLEDLSAGGGGDRKLALDIGRAYSLLARAQGITPAANVEQHRVAEASLKKAADLVNPILASEPGNREALLAGARISHDRMIVAESQHRSDQTLVHARRAVEHLDRLRQQAPLTRAEAETISEFLYHIAVTHKNLHLFQDGIRYSRQSVEISRTLPNGALRAGLGLSMVADLCRLTGDLEGALATIAEARKTLQEASFPNEAARYSSRIALLWREGKILGAPNGLSLNRTADAIAVLQEAYDLIEQWSQNDPDGTWSRLFFASIGRELGELVRARDPQRALAIYDHSLQRLHEVRDNAEARRAEAELSAVSSYALRRLGRTAEAGERIEFAFRTLSQSGEYPAARVVPHSTAEAAFRALGDHYAETGKLEQAVRVYEDLLEKFIASKPDPQRDLRHAMAISHIYGSLATLYSREGKPDRSKALTAQRIGLWRDWERRSPQSELFLRQVELAKASEQAPSPNR
jgi:serine/threonine protein kinase